MVFKDAYRSAAFTSEIFLSSSARSSSSVGR
jgi:hypothetical protein